MVGRKASLAIDRSLWPVGVELPDERVATPVATTSDSFAIDFCDLVVSAFTRQGYSDKEAAAAIQTPYKVYLKAINTAPDYDAYNPVMKGLRYAPVEVIRDFFALGAAKVGLSHGIDHAKVEAAVRLSDAVTHLLRVSQR